MIKLMVICPFCKMKQGFISYQVHARYQLGDRRKKCIVCDKTFPVRENMIKEISFRPGRRSR